VNGKAEPRFDLDLKYGVEGEQHIAQLLNWVVNGNHQVEVKRKRLLDLYFYVETHCDKGRRGEYQPSGISVTTASQWFFVLGDSGVTVSFPTDLLRSMISDDEAHAKPCEAKDGDCPTRGKLINLAVLLYRYQKRQQTTKNITPALPRVVAATAATMTADEINWGFGL